MEAANVGDGNAMLPQEGKIEPKWVFQQASTVDTHMEGRIKKA